MASAAVRQFKTGRVGPLIEKYKWIKTASPENYGGSWLKNAMNEIPEVMFMSIFAFIGFGITARGYMREMKDNTFSNKPYKRYYFVMRPDDPKVKNIRPEYYAQRND